MQESQSPFITWYGHVCVFIRAIYLTLPLPFFFQFRNGLSALPAKLGRIEGIRTSIRGPETVAMVATLRL
jgi:hypothetical protein